ncbi:zinc finger BED domain-containing protein RICESLEEPER 1-like [Apium graveolens]|uniref:zinc finger BED domain-containing protein RICESLEEPER 1-like n=1 Tax=Apium graveolens TaxID=4045 RepID=UPI003D7B74B9
MDSARDSNLTEANNNTDPNGISSNQTQTGSRSRTKRKPVALRSDIWDDFTRFRDATTGELRGKCKHFGSEFAASSFNETSSMRKHLEKSCKGKPKDDASQRQITGMKTQAGGDSLVSIKVDVKLITKTIAEMIIIDELPFKHFDGLGFQHLMALAFPKFKLPSRFTVQRDCFGIFCAEKRKLKHILMRKKQIVCLTTDTWTSIRKVNFMCLTAHYINEDRKLCKKLLSFTPITSHRGKDIGRSVEKCLRDWGIENIFTVTADDASSNDVAIEYLKDEFSRIRDAVKYVKNSAARLSKFEECMEMENDGNNAELTLDVFTRWNSTYMMLDAALKHEKVWKRYEKEDIVFAIDLADGKWGTRFVNDGLKIKHLSLSIKRIRDAVKYVKNSAARLSKFEECMEMENDGNNAELTLDVSTRWNSRYMMLDAALKHEKTFYEFTLKISGSKYVTSNLFYHELLALNGTLKSWIRSDNEDLSTIASKMQEKFDKYWGDPLKMNKLIFMGAVLDPRFKLGYVEFTMERLYENIMLASTMKRQLKDALYELFNNYKEKYSLTSDEGCSSGKSTVIFSDVNEENQSSDISQVWLNEYMTEFGMLHGGSSARSELDVYLEESRVSGDQKFDILNWWKGNCVRFPILSQMARDILAIPVSTVASESVFSTGGWVLDAFRSSLSPVIAEALLCAQDWLRGSLHSNDVEENDDDQEKLAKGENLFS